MSSSGSQFRQALLQRLTGLLLIAMVTGPVNATEVARFSVGAVVPPVATMNTLDVRREIQISAADIARGSIDVPAAMQIEVRSNNPQGYVLNVRPRVAMFTSARIVGLDSAVNIGSEGAVVVQRGQYERVTRVSMDYRFFLAPGLLPGTYPWPVQLSVAPL